MVAAFPWIWTWCESKLVGVSHCGRRSESGAAGVKAGFYRSKEKAARRDFEVIGGDCFGGVDGFLAVRRADTVNSR